MSDKYGAYRGDAYHPHAEDEAQNSPVIDPQTGLPVQQQQWAQNAQGYVPQEGYAPQGQGAPQGHYGYVDPNGQSQYAQSSDYSAQNPYSQGGQDPAGYGQADSGAYAPSSQEAYQGGYQQEGYVEQDPYMAAHQNATPPFDPSQHGMAASDPYQEQTSYQEQAYYQAQVDSGQAPAVYNAGAAGVQPMQQGGAQQGYATPYEGYSTDAYAYDGGYDYNAQYAAQGAQPQGIPHLNDPYSPAPLHQAQADVRDDELAASGRKSFLVGAMILGSVIVGGGVAFAYKYSGDNGNGRAPVIVSEGGSGKVLPDDPGGLEFKNQNKKIYDRLGDSGSKTVVAGIAQTDEDVTESLRGGMKEPSSGDQTAVKRDEGPGGPRYVKTLQFNRHGQPIADGRARDVQVKDVKDMDGVGVTSGKPPVRVKTVRAGAAVQQQQVQSNVGDGSYVVQISARRSEQDALVAFSSLKSKYGSVLDGYRPLIQRADLGSKGIFYRLRVGPMQTKETATSVCSELKSKGLPSCFVTDR